MFNSKLTNKDVLQLKFLRFPQFDEKLTDITLGEICEFQRGNGLNLKSLIKNGKNKCIHYSELLNYNTIIKNIKSKTNDNGSILSSGNDVLISASFHSSKIQPFISLKEKNVILGSDINIFRINDSYNSDYVALYLSSNKNSKIVQKFTEGSVVNHIYGKYMLKINIFLTKNKKEQIQVVNFFEKIIYKIDSENNLKSKWTFLLKSINEKTLEKNKNDMEYYVINGKLKEFFSFFSGLVSNTAHVNEKHKNNLLPYAIVREKTTCDYKDLVHFNGKGNPQSVLNKNDVLFISNSGSKKNVGLCSIYTSDVKAFLSSCCFGMRLKEKYNNVIDPRYINAIFNWVEYRSKIKSLISGSVVNGISMSLFEGIIIKLPSYKTQIFISNMFYKITKIIEIQNKLIEKNKLLKKYFLDSMF